MIQLQCSPCMQKFQCSSPTRVGLGIFCIHVSSSKIRNGNKYVIFLLQSEHEFCKLNINLLESKEYKLHVNAVMKDVSKIMLSYIDKSEVPTHVG